jgi:hypothetical protein
MLFKNDIARHFILFTISFWLRPNQEEETVCSLFQNTYSEMFQLLCAHLIRYITIVALLVCPRTALNFNLITASTILQLQQYGWVSSYICTSGINISAT